MKKFILFGIGVVLFILYSCHQPTNLVDPKSNNYIGEEVIDADGDGVGNYYDVDEISLESPNDGSELNTTTPELTVYKFDENTVNKYHIQISTDKNNFADHIVFEKDSYDSHQCIVPANTLIWATNYYWRAKAYDDTKWSDNWSEIKSFFIVVDSLNTISPQNGNTIIDTTPLIDWDDINGASGYRIQINDTSDYTGTMVVDDDSLTNSSFQVSSVLSDNEIYYWRIKWKNSNGVWGDWADTWSFTIDIDLVNPTYLSPQNGNTIIDTTPLIDWDDINGASGYRIQINDTNDYTGTLVVDDDSLTNSSFQVSSVLSDNETYYWRIKWKNSDGVWGEWANSWSFNLDITSPNYTSPENEQCISDTTPILKWEVLENTNGYWVQVNTKEDFSGSMIVDDNSLAITETEISTILSYDTTYYWRVKRKNHDGVWSDWGEIWNFTVNEYVVGDTGPAGGIIFYDENIDGNDDFSWRYLEAAPEDQGSAIEWGGKYTLISFTNPSIGKGLSNTQEIIAKLGSGTYAAKVCDNLNINGYEDWFLPSKDELYLLYDNLYNNDIGNLQSKLYWSSTEISDYAAESLDFSDGHWWYNEAKDDANYVRAIRSF